METQPLSPESLAFVEELYAQFLSDPRSVAEDWRRYFEAEAHNGRQAQLGPSFKPASVFNPAAPTQANTLALDASDLLLRVEDLVRAYRLRGHLAARIDPLGAARVRPKELELATYGWSERDRDRPVPVRSMRGVERLALGELVDRLERTWCGPLAVETAHIDDEAVQRWVWEWVETHGPRATFSREDQLFVLGRLTDAVLFEEFIQKKFLGAKSFSIEGSETLLPLIDLAIEGAAAEGVVEIVLGMAHRGRLNVLANVLGKEPGRIFREFDDQDADLYLGRGDVKYHKGHSSDYVTRSGARVHVSLCFNPSHLEFVNPVALGRVRAKQDRFGDRERAKGFALLIHGDAAFIGEGVVQESLNLTELEGYRTGGALHVVVNNQLGFTTSPRDGRSGGYCTDIAKMLAAPILHVNGEDPEAAAAAVALALEFRRVFRRDVVIDLIAFRRRGHNEGDEPSFTDPLLYAQIAQRKTMREVYRESLGGAIDTAEAEALETRTRAWLEAELAAARAKDFSHAKDGQGPGWTGLYGGPEHEVPQVDTAVGRGRLVEILRKLSRPPTDFALHPKLVRFVEARAEMAEGQRELDWSAGEALALATLSLEGRRVRLSGQDTQRGTFSHRHAVLHDTRTGARRCPLAELAPDQAPLEIHNSPLSETGVLGFEYGYSLDFPEGLILWEAQFGDFVNVAQVIIDQFLVSAEDKWSRLSGLVLLLPHGFEGQGPEHSSARLERLLNLFTDDNIQVVNPTTPAQLFHVLRRQVLRPWRKPLFVMTPKSLLRHPRAVSTLDDLASGSFRRILPDRLASKNARRVLLVSGKLAYELEDAREAGGHQDVAILRVEQLAPLTERDVEAALASYPSSAELVWVQEEPENMGAWRSLCARWGETVAGRRWRYVGRKTQASPATGSLASHKIEQVEIQNQAFAR